MKTLQGCSSVMYEGVLRCILVYCAVAKALLNLSLVILFTAPD